MITPSHRDRDWRRSPGLSPSLTAWVAVWARLRWRCRACMFLAQAGMSSGEWLDVPRSAKEFMAALTPACRAMPPPIPDIAPIKPPVPHPPPVPSDRKWRHCQRASCRPARSRARPPVAKAAAPKRGACRADGRAPAPNCGAPETRPAAMPGPKMPSANRDKATQDQRHLLAPG